MVMEVVKIDEQGRLVIPKGIRERKGLKGEVQVLETEEGVIVKPRKAVSWDEMLDRKVKVDWSKALTVSLEDISLDELLLG